MLTSVLGRRDLLAPLLASVLRAPAGEADVHLDPEAGPGLGTEADQQRGGGCNQAGGGLPPGCVLADILALQRGPLSDSEAEQLLAALLEAGLSLEFLQEVSKGGEAAAVAKLPPELRGRVQQLARWIIIRISTRLVSTHIYGQVHDERHGAGRLHHRDAEPRDAA